MTNAIIDSNLYWRLPGPRSFITRISEKVLNTRLLWVNLPIHSIPGTWDGVEEGVRHAHIDNVIKLRISGGTDISGEVGVHFDKLSLTAAELILHTADRRSAVILLPQDNDGKANCSKYAEEFMQSIDKGVGNVLLIIGGNEESIIADTSNMGIQVIAFDGGLSQDEMDAYVAIRMLDRPGPGSTRLTRAIVSEFAGFDVELAEQIMQLNESQIVNIMSNLGILMGDSPFRWRYDSWLWLTRSSSTPGMTHSLHDKYLSEHGAVSGRSQALDRIKQRYWRACVKTISPWLEERRKAVIGIFGTQIKAEAAHNNGMIPKFIGKDRFGNDKFVQLDPEELEYNNIVGMIRHGKLSATTVEEKCAESVCRLTKGVRDEIAHLRAPSAGEVSDLIWEMDRLPIDMH
jgi:hypothetical protein